MNTLNRIPCTEARNLVMSMIAVNPDNRLSATEYLANWYVLFSARTIDSRKRFPLFDVNPNRTYAGVLNSECPSTFQLCTSTLPS